MKTPVLIPRYNHPAAITHVAQTMYGFGLDVSIVDDGSCKECKPVLQALVPDGIRIPYRPINDGKGAVVKTGLKYAEEHGYSYVLQVDADGQRHLGDTPKFLAVAEQNPGAVVCGWPQYGGDALKTRLYGCKITDFWNMLHTWLCDIKDGMCGFRPYPLAPAFSIVREEAAGDHTDSDTEIPIRLYWCGIKPAWIKTPVQYAADGASHFNAFVDNVRISKIHARLFLGMLQRRLGVLFGRGRLRQ